MSRIIAKIRKSGKAMVALLMFVLASSAVAVFFAFAEGGHELPADYANFFGLNPNDSSDVELDYDNDGLFNWQEAQRWTDPLANDTDRDGWNDAVDDAPISRAYMPFGEPLFTHTNDVIYTWPLWMIAAYKTDGEWTTNPPAWHVPASESNDVGYLSIIFDRSILTNDIRMKMEYADFSNSSLYVDLLDTNLNAMAADFSTNNIIIGSGTDVVTILNIPLFIYTNAIGVQLRRGTGEITVYDSLLYIDQDGDGLDEAQETQLGTSDTVSNSWPSCLTVNCGSGSGWYVAGASVSIAANSAPTGQVFNGWTGDTGILAARFSSSTTATVPSNNVAVTATFVAIQSAEGRILREVYTNITGSAVSNLTGSSAYPNNPATLDKPTSFEAPQNVADYYGTRMRGYIHPQQTGNYTFWIAADDSAQLWLSPNDAPSNKVMIASVASWTSYRQWTKYSSQQSSNIYLVANRRYYIEALHKEGNGGDNLSVAWQGPGISQSVIAGSYLSSVATNLPPIARITISTNIEDISTTVNFSAATSTDPEGGSLTYSWDFGDGSYGNGVTNAHAYESVGIYTTRVAVVDDHDLSSFAIGTIQIVNMRDPENPTNTASGIEYKYFEGTWTNLPDFDSLTPVRINTTTNFNLNPRLRDTSIGFKYTGYIHVSTDGQYTFYTTSDDGSKLYIGTQELVSNDGIHGMIEKSGSLWLRAGKHAIKVIMFQNSGGYGLEVRYSGPGISKQIIPPGALYRQTTPVTLTVNNGTGSGSYETGWTIPIAANSAASGTTFTAWMGESNIIASIYATNTILTMPAVNTGITAAYMTNGVGTILREVWTGISGTTLNYLTNNSAYPNFPAFASYLTSMEAPTNWADSYGTRLQGYLHAPLTGDYSFWIASDDYGELWLSSDEAVSNKVLIASVSGYTGYRTWTTYTNQHSTTIQLEAGKKYYIEALQKESAGGDNLSVAWQGPGISQSVISNIYLSPFVTNFMPFARMAISTNVEDILTPVTFNASTSTDPESDPLSYSWDFGDGNTANGITADHSYANVGTYTARVTVADDKGAASIASGVIQIVNMRDPENPANTASGIGYKYYEGTWTNLPDFDSLSPVRMNTTTNFNLGPRLRDTFFGFNFSGYIQVSSDGLYTFYTYSDDGSKLYIGSQEIVSNDGVHAATEKSGSLWLRAGKHAITVTMFAHNTPNSLEVRYSGTGISKQIIPLNVLYRQTNPVTLTVTDGSGSGAYDAGWTIPVIANPAPSGMVFASWTGDTNVLSSLYTTNTLVTMPAGNVMIAVDYMTNGFGTILREVYAGITGETIGYLTNNSAFPNWPTIVDQRATFEAPTNWADNYGTRMRGYLHVPVSGNYTFWIASDNNGQLWLSTDEESSNKVMIASVPGWTGYRSWNSYTSQVSSAVYLEAHKKYYIEALQKEGTGEDNLSVAWQGPSIAQSVIGTEYLSAVVTNYAPYAKISLSTNIVGYPDSVNFSAVASFDPEGDTLSYLWGFGDGNTGSGVTNVHAYASIGTYTASVTVADSKDAVSTASAVVRVINMLDAENPANLASGIEYKYYEGSWTNLPDFDALSPVRCNITTNFNLDPRLRDTLFGFQFTGYIQVPADGEYKFYTTSDDGSKLFIGGQEIVSNDGLHAMIEQSGAIGLRAGIHAIKVIMFQGANLYGLEVRYEGPGISKQIIPGEVLYRESNPVTLTVNNGTGSGVYEPGWMVAITADFAPTDTVFDAWVGDVGGVVNIYAPDTFVTMPATNIAVTANFIPKVTGTILREVWTGISGTSIDSLTNSLFYPDVPDTWELCTSFEAPTNWADYYGTRMSGYLYPPVSGDYTFYIASDDNSQLWLSPDGNPANKALIAWVSGWNSWTDYRQWTKFTSQKSAVIHLEAGRRYYIEALQKEGISLDNLSVAWTGAVGSETNIIAGTYLSPSITNFAPIASMTVNPSVVGVSSSVGFDASASTDPENDPLSYAWNFGDGNTGSGVTNSHAYSEVGTYTARVTVADSKDAHSSATAVIRVIPMLDAVNPSNVGSGIEYKYYEGTWSNLPAFDVLSPVRFNTITNFDLSPRLRDTLFGFQYTGYIQVPVDGEYTFYTSSDDGSRLFIDSQEIVSNDGIHAMTEKSGIIGLRAGMHAISVTMFQGTSLYGLEVSYEGPGISKQIIPASVLYRQSNPVTLIVNNGTGGGEYEAGWTVGIVADESPSGMVFSAWAGDVNISDVYAPSTIVTMPATNITVAADYIPRNTGSILREVWTGISGTSITNLLNSSFYPDFPDVWGSCTNFEAPQNFADNYGTRMRGYLCPLETGDYTFYIASDDNSELWLSPGGNSSNKVLIAWVNGWTNYREWTRGASQKSVAIHLEAGGRYYIEALQKEGNGGDHLSVAWQWDEMPTNVISGTYLMPITIDNDSNGLPDAWEMQYFGSTGQNPSADPDNDGISNLQEFLRGTNPNDAADNNISIYVNAVTGKDTNYGLTPNVTDGRYGPFATIKAAINSAVDGDRIVVEAGTYNELPATYSLGEKHLTLVLNGDVVIR